MSKYKSKEFLSASESDADDSGSEAEEVPKKVRIAIFTTQLNLVAKVSQDEVPAIIKN